MNFWIARDKDGSLWMYDNEPVLRSEKSWGVRPKPTGETKPAKQLQDWYFPEERLRIVLKWLKLN